MGVSRIETKHKIIFGADWFPEQWPEDVWHEDIRLMKEAKVNMISLAIFAWALLQPGEETFTFEWLDRIMDLLADHGIDVCLGTSTAAQPNWLTQNYDDILFVRENGERTVPGSRQTYCINSPNYRKAVRLLVTEIAGHYKNHPALKLWHINNEYANKNSMCFCPTCGKKFQEWLEDKYKTLDHLNECWGTVFWGEKYFTWDQINAPRASAGGRNGTKLLDYKRFLSESFHSLYLEEYNILRDITPNIPITTNFEGDWSKFDHSLFKDHLDVVSWNCYPNPLDADARRWVALRHSMMRSLLGKPFMLMEQAPSQVDWYPVNVNKRPGQMRLWSYQAIAHGSDSVMYFQWRASRKGAEKYHSGMVPHFGENSRIFKEISELGNELSQLEEIVASQIDAPVAILMDNDSWWAIDNPYGSGNKSLDNETFWAANGQPFPSVLLSYFGELEHYFNAFYDFNIPVDVIPVHYDFSKYKIVIAPLLHMIKPEFQHAVESFVCKGGTFITTYFSGLIDEHVGVFPGGYPGPLKEVLGIEVEEFDPLPLNGRNQMKMSSPMFRFKKEYESSIWCDVVHTTTAKTLATFSEDYYAGCPCFTENEFGKGKAYYIASRPDQFFMRDFIKFITADYHIQIPSLPQNVEYITRSKEEQDFHFYLNHGNDEVEIQLLQGKYQDMITNTISENIIRLKKFGVSILRRITDNGQ